MDLDMKLDRRIEFDERSRNYRAVSLIDRQTMAPRSKRWRCNPYLDQGTEGACVGFAWAHELAAEPDPVRDMSNIFAQNIYYSARQVDPWPGEDYEGTSVLAGAKVCKELRYISEYRWAFGLEDLILAVGHLGPAVLGVNWYEGMDDTWDCGRLHFSSTRALGGHAILCSGVNVRDKYFVLHNSWGKDWGTGGNARVGFQLMNSLLQDQGEACIPVTRRQP
jgi:hypothetical protein